MTFPEFRIGQGIDFHVFTTGRPCILGGVDIPHPLGLLGHSDADALIHALCDALLGAAALGDIGHHFPDTDEKWKDADSRLLLRKVAASLCNAGWTVINADVTVVAQKPRLSPHVAQMRQNLAADMNVEVERISIKATTSEKMGAIGREEGIGVWAVALIARAPVANPIPTFPGANQA